MHTHKSDFFQTSFRNFFHALLNLGMFIPYLFSVRMMLLTLFSPWKNITKSKTTLGFSVNEWLNRLGFNLVSRGMGFIIRSSMILGFVFVMIGYVVFLPVVVIMYFLLLPLLFLLSLAQKSPEDMKVFYKELFIAHHMLDKDHYQEVEQWFESIYAEHYTNKEWWRLENLQAYPPLGRNWAKGYTPTLDQYTVELTSSSYQNSIRPIVGRSAELNLLERALSKTEESNVLIIGEDGVGRHAVIESFSARIYEGKTNPNLIYKRVLKVMMEKIVSQATDQSQREEFLEELMLEAAVAGNVILVIDDFDRYASTGKNRIDMTTPFERFARSTLQIIGITSPFMYETYLQNNEKLRRSFTKITISEVSKEQAVRVMLEVALDFERRFNMYIPYETVLQTVDRSEYFLTTMPFPEKAIHVLDNACVYAQQTAHTSVLTPEIVDRTVSEIAHVPTQLSTRLKEKLLTVETLLKEYIVSQNEAVQTLASALRRSFLLIGKRKKPLATFLFLGPTGVGKTETAKAITQIFFESDTYLIRFDMSAYQTKQSIAELIGTTDSADPGLLTRAIREKPYGVLLLDEIEKADKDILNIFLTILDEGYFTDGVGKRVDCKELVIIATSNAGSDYIYNKIAGNGNDAPQKQIDPAQFSQELTHYLIERGIFAPEFLNRFDGVIAYQPLQTRSVEEVAKKFMSSVAQQIYENHKVHVVVSDETLHRLASQSYDPSFGARDMERIIRQEIEDHVAKLVLSGSLKPEETVKM